MHINSYRVFTGKKSQNHAADIGTFFGLYFETSRNPDAHNQVSLA
jgi:hypothetical protein